MSAAEKIESVESVEPVETGDPIVDALASLGAPEETANEETAEETVEALPEEPVEEPEKEEPKPEPKKKGAWKPDERLLSDEALATPEGIKAAAEHLAAGKREIHRKWLGIEEREQRFSRTKQETLQLRQNLQAQFGILQNNIQALRTGDANTALQALGALTGKDPVRVLEELNINIARNGKQSASPEVLELREQLAQIKAEREQERLQAKQREQAEFVQRRQVEMLQLAERQPTQWPSVARFLQDNPRGVAEALHEIKVDYFQRKGESLGDAETIAALERQLQYFRSVPETENRAAAEAVGGRETTVSDKRKPEVGAQRTPGKSPTPGLASRSVTVREMTERERLDDLANDPDLMRMLGL